MIFVLLNYLNKIMSNLYIEFDVPKIWQLRSLAN